MRKTSEKFTTEGSSMKYQISIPQNQQDLQKGKTGKLSQLKGA